MSAVVTCQCGQSFRAPPRLFGQTVKCPKCQQPLYVPDPNAPEPAAELEPAPELQADPFASPLDSFGGGNDPLAAAAAYSAPTSAGPAPHKEPAPDMGIVMWAGVGAGSIVVLLVLAMIVTRMVSRPAAAPNVPAAAPVAAAKPVTPAPTPAAPAAPATTAPPVAATPIASAQPSTPVAAPVASAPAADGWVTTKIRDRFEVQAPGALVLTTPEANNRFEEYMLKLDFGDKKTAAYEFRIRKNPSIVTNNLKTYEKDWLLAGEKMRKFGKPFALSQVTINGQQGVRINSGEGIEDAWNVTFFLDSSHTEVMILVRRDNKAIPDADMERFLNSFRVQ